MSYPNRKPPSIATAAVEKHLPRSRGRDIQARSDHESLPI
jgi:hypothetical protein